MRLFTVPSGNLEDDRDLLVVHVFEIAQNDGLAQLWREFGQRGLNLRTSVRCPA